MATRLFVCFGPSTSQPDVLTHGCGLNVDPDFSHWNPSTAYSWGGSTHRLELTRAAIVAGLSLQTQDSVAGPVTKDGLESQCAFSKPLAAGFTLAGTVSFNAWAAEAASTVNAGLIAKLFKLTALGELVAVLTTGVSSEVPSPTRAAVAWSGSPTSTDFAKGDRLVVWLGCWKDAGGTMASGTSNIQISFNGSTASADGDTWMELTENITFADDDISDVTGSTLYLRDSASAVDAGADEKEMLATAGTTETTAVKATVAGPVTTLAQQWTKTSGGTAIEWYSDQLEAFTLSGIVFVKLFANVSNTAANANLHVELARVDGDGTNAVPWARALVRASTNAQQNSGELSTSRKGHMVMLAGPDLGIAGGQRLRFRVYLEDDYGFGGAPVASGHTATIYYDDNDDAASTGAQSRIRLQQTVAAWSGPPEPVPTPYRVQYAQVY